MKKWYKFVAVSFHIVFFHSLLSLSAAAHAQTSTADCEDRDISDYQWGIRHRGGLPAEIELDPGTMVEECIKLNGVGKYPLTLTSRDLEISLNGAAFVIGSELTIHEGDTLRFRAQAPAGFGVSKTFRLTFKESDPDRRRDVFRLRWPIQTRNDEREPKTWRVGPSSANYREVKDVLRLLSAGDTILLEANATYEPFEVKDVSGTAKRPILLKGETTDPAQRPVIEGGTKRFNWTVGLTNSHNWVIDNVVLQEGGLCFRHSSNNTTLKNVLIRHCNTGILSTDFDSGDLTLKNIELYDAGGKEEKRPWNHGIYVASDQHTFPGATFTIENSYLHDVRGNAIKSRFQNTVIKHNWIEGSKDKQARYLVEVIGFDGQYDFQHQQHDVTENILIHRMPGLSGRAGGDGKSASRGDARFTHNVYVIEKGFNRSLVRTFQGLRSLTIADNQLAFLDSTQRIMMLSDELKDEQWLEGTPVITISNNNIASSTQLIERTAKGASVRDMPEIKIENNNQNGAIVVEETLIDTLRPQKNNYIDVPQWPNL